MVSVWQFHITDRLAKGEKFFQADTARKDEQLQENADTKHYFHVPYDSNSLFKSRAYRRPKSARGNCVNGHWIDYACAECARGGALFEHNQK